MITLKDIAQRAGVTATTVSRVINNRGYISEETRRKVYEVMEEMHYQPNELARAFSRQYTSTIGLIVPHITHPFFTKVISNMESAAADKGFKLLLCNSKEQPEKEKDYLDLCMSNRVAGIVLCSKYIQTQEFHKMHIPVVNLERGDDDGTISVQCDNYQGGRMAAEHLIKCGCKSLLHFGGIKGKDMPADRRADAFSDVCKKAGIPYRVLVSDRLLYGSMHYEEFISKALLEYPDVDGIFASSDLIASQVIQVCAQMGKKVPEDIQLIGFDDVMISTVTTPQITTIHQPVEEMTELCVEYITKILNNKSVPQKIVLPVRLVQRESTVMKETER